MNSEKLNATPIFDEETERWNVYVSLDGEFLSVGRTINEEMGLFETLEFKTRDEAKDWIINNDKFTYKETIANGF